MKLAKSFGVLLIWTGLFIVTLALPGRNEILADDDLPAGEIPFAGVKNERPHYLRLLSGKLFRVRGKNSETSADGGKTWQQGDRTNPFQLGWKLPDYEIQLQSGPHKGRILIPYYLGLYGKHPDYDRKQRGGYVWWKGKLILLETHTHYPEMSGSFVCYSDDEGKKWNCSVSSNARGFMVGYIKDGHLGHWTCEEPAIAELKDGRILCFMRSTCGRILKSYSEDGGANWMKVQPTDIAMSNSPCALKRLPGTGDLVMVWNMMSAEEIRKGYRRGRLCIAISKDDGETWENVKALELSPGLEECDWVEPPPLQPMVRGPSGRDNPMGKIPDGFKHYHYSSIFLSEDKIFIKYAVSPAAGPGATSRWRAFPISWLYEPEEGAARSQMK